MTDTTWLTSLRDAVAEIWRQVLESLPSVFGAILLLVIGWIVAKLLQALTTRSLARAGALFGNRTVQSELQTAGVDRLASRAIGAIVFWLVLVVFVAAAGEFLGLAVITTGLNRLAEYLPAVLGAVVVLLAGAIVASIARTAVMKAATRAGAAYGPMLGQGIRGVILLVTAVVALDQLGIDSELLIAATNILIAAVVGGAALAFALGSRTTVSNVLAQHYVVQHYEIGQRVRLDDLEGEIVEFKKTGVVIESPAGRTLVPAVEFSEKRSTLIPRVDR